MAPSGLMRTSRAAAGKRARIGAAFSAFKGRRAAVCGSLAGAAILAAGIVTMAPAHATGIDQFDTGGSRCGAVNPNWAFCLWYSPNMDGGIWGSTGDISTISGNFGNGGDGTAGDGALVRNDAASAAMNVNSGQNYTCSRSGVFIWVYPGYTGSYDSLNDWYGGNLTSGLRNNEASIQC